MLWISIAPISNKILSCLWLSNNSSLNNNSKLLRVALSNLWDLLKCNSNSSSSNNNNKCNNSNSCSKTNKCRCNSSLCLTTTSLICNNHSSCNNLKVILKEIIHNQISSNSKFTLRVPWKMTDKLSPLMVALTISKLPSQLPILIKTFMVAL